MYEFQFERPATIEDAVAALAKPDAQALGGGQTLIPLLKQRLSQPACIVSLGGISGLAGLREADGSLHIGAATTHADVASGAGAYPALAALAGRIGDPAVRNRGTIGGSLAYNDPSACYPAAALASGAAIVTNRREVAADDYFQGMLETALDEGEVITEVRFPIPQTASYQKFPQPASRFALVGVFVARFSGAVRVAVTGAFEGGVKRWLEAEQVLSSSFNVDAIANLAVAPAGIIEDIHGSSEYRAHLIGVMTRRAVEEAAG